MNYAEAPYTKQGGRSPADVAQGVHISVCATAKILSEERPSSLGYAMISATANKANDIARRPIGLWRPALIFALAFFNDSSPLSVGFQPHDLPDHPKDYQECEGDRYPANPIAHRVPK